MAESTYLLVIILNVNGPNVSIKRHRLAEWIKKIYVLPTRDTLQMQGHTQAESEGTEKHIACKWNAKESQSSYIRKNRL